MRPGALSKIWTIAVAAWLLSGAVAFAQSSGFTVEPLDPVDPVDPADPIDPIDPDQGSGNAGFGVAVNPDMGLIQTPLPELDPDTGFVASDGQGTVLQNDPNGQDGVALIQTRNMMAEDTITSVTAAVAPAAQLRGLDRTVGETTDFTVAVGETVVLGGVAIQLSECRYPADNPASDAFAHLRIADLDGRSLFDGWMIASSPALMALEHPRYDVWVLSCSTS